MTLYHIKYEYQDDYAKKYGYTNKREASVEASSIKYAKKKLMRKHNVKSIKILDVSVGGYF